MKKLLCVLSFLGIIPAILSSCSHTIYVLVDKIEIEPYTFFYSSNPISGEIKRIDSVFISNTPIAYNAIYWKVSTVYGYASHTTLSEFIPKANAFTRDQSPYFINIPEDIYIIALLDFNNHYEKGDTINQLFEIRDERDSVVDLKSFISSQNKPENRYNHDTKMLLYLKEPVIDSIDFSFRVIFKYENDIFHFTDTKPLTIY